MRHTDRIFIIAAAGCAAATVLFGVTLARALTVEPTIPAAADPLLPPSVQTQPIAQEGTEDQAVTAPEVPLVREGDPAVVPRGPLSMNALLLAVENDPFQESRQRPPERYRMPGDAIEDAGPPPLPPPPPFQVLGIAQSAGGGLAVMQVEDSPPRVLSVGESLFGYTLDRVEGEVATLSGQGRILTLTVAEASPTPVVDEDSRSGRRGREAEDVIERLRGRRDDDDRMEQVREMQQNAVEMIRRMMEQQQRRGNNRGGRSEATYRVDGGRVILRADTNVTVLPPAPPRR